MHSKIYNLKEYLNESGFYGLGEKYGVLNLIGRDTANFNTDVLAVSPIHTSVQREYHTSIPFYIGIDENKAYGIYFDNTYKTYFDFNKSQDGVLFKADGGNLDYYFIMGDSVDEVVKNYSKITGTMKLPRRDFLGYQQSRWSYKTKDELMKVARRMYKEKIPCDVFYLDIDYMDNYKVFTIDNSDFKEFKLMVKELNSMGYKLVTIIDPGIKKEKEYFVYENGLKKDYFIKNKNEEIYVGEVWPGESVFPDFLRKEVREWWGNLHKVLIDNGVSGIWNDMNEIADFVGVNKTLPIDSYHLDDEGNKRYQKEIHNIYGHLEAEATYNGLIKLENNRPFILTRSAFAGTQRYSALWTGDNASIWEHLETAIPMMINLSLSGFNFIGADMGGFLEDSNGELLTRWVQFGIFTPLFRNHCALNFINQEPWCFGENYLEVIKKFIEMRYSLIPHIYNMLYKASIDGTSVIRPLFYKKFDEKAMDINDEFLFGDNILVAPIYKPRQKKKKVYLPDGIWFDYFTDKKYKGNEYYLFDVVIDKFPMFVKAGAIIPKQAITTNLDELPEIIEINVYLGDDNEYNLYLDDGLSFEYKNGKSSAIKFEIKNNKVTSEIIKNGFKLPEFKIITHK
jgi:alpha-glucosidase